MNGVRAVGGAGARLRNPARHFFFGVGLNLQEIFLKEHKSTAARWAWTALNYVQVPYTAAYVSAR